MSFRIAATSGFLEQRQSNFQVVGEYFTLAQITNGSQSTSAALFKELVSLRRSDVILVCATLLEAVGRGGIRQTQLKLIDELLSHELKEKVQRLASEKVKWVVFHRRQIWLLLQFACLACPDDTPSISPEELLRSVGKTLLMASDILQEVESSVIPLNDSSELAMEWIASVLVSHSESPLSINAIGRAYAFWFESLKDSHVREEFERLGCETGYEELFEGKYGIKLEKWFDIALSFYLIFFRGCSGLPIQPSMLDISEAPDDWAAIEEKRLVVKMLSINIEKLSAYLLGRPRQSWVFDYSPLQKYPLLEMFPDRFACPDLLHFRQFFVEGIFWLLNDAVGASKWRKFFGEIYAWYLRQVIGEFCVVSGDLVKTAFFSPKFQRTEDEVCDGLLLWQNTAVVGEFKSNRMTSHQRTGASVEEKVKAIEDVAGGRGAVTQLAKSITRILKGVPVYSGGEPIDLLRCNMFVPMLVWYEESACNYAVRNLLQDELHDQLKKADIDLSKIGSFVLFSTADVELFELVARKKAAEEVINKYVQYLSRHQHDPSNGFQAFVQNTFGIDSLGEGFVEEKTKGVLKDMARRISPAK